MKPVRKTGPNPRIPHGFQWVCADPGGCRGKNISIGIKNEANQFSHSVPPAVTEASYNFVRNTNTPVSAGLHHNGGGAGGDRIGFNPHRYDRGDRVRFAGIGFVQKTGDCCSTSSWRDRPAEDTKLGHSYYLSLRRRPHHTHHGFGPCITRLLACCGKVGKFFDNAHYFVRSTELRSISVSQHSHAPSGHIFPKVEARPNRAMVHA
jgi:hypothetical protein